MISGYQLVQFIRDYLTDDIRIPACTVYKRLSTDYLQMISDCTVYRRKSHKITKTIFPPNGKNIVVSLLVMIPNYIDRQDYNNLIIRPISYFISHLI